MSNQTQLTLFPPVSRNTDPISSKLAELEINQTGQRLKHIQLALRLVILHPARTTRELANFCPDDMNHYQLAKRLSDLKNMGKIQQGPARICSVGGRKSVTWHETTTDKGAVYAD
jgi:hypothetical protein